MQGSLSSFLKDIIDKYDRQHPGGNEDMVRTPLETETAPSEDNTITPDKVMRDKAMGSDKRNIIDDSGNIVDMDLSSAAAGLAGNRNPFAKAMGALQPGGNGEGTLSGFVSRLLGSGPERNNGGLVPNTGQATTPDLDPTPSKDQTQGQLAPVPLPRLDPRRYSLSGLPVQQLDELKNSLLKDSGQNVDPNSLAGRMSHPNAPSEMGQQGAEAVNIADDIRGFNGRRSEALKKGKPHV